MGIHTLGAGACSTRSSDQIDLPAPTPPPKKERKETGSLALHLKESGLPSSRKALIASPSRQG